MDNIRHAINVSQRAPLPLVAALAISTIVGLALLVGRLLTFSPPFTDILKSYLGLFIVAPIPRPPVQSEKNYTTIGLDGEIRKDKRLPCWQDKYDEERRAAQDKGDFSDTTLIIEEPEVFVSLVVPAFNEEERLGIMLTEAVGYLQSEYGSAIQTKANGIHAKRKDVKQELTNGHASANGKQANGWEVLVVSDGSTDKTIDTALQFARDLGGKAASNIRVIHLHENRGKGGAVTHGMRHVRGQYAVFADADGASRFEDLGKLVESCRKIEDDNGRGVAVGSRAHLVGSEAVVKVCITVPLRDLC